MWPLDGEEDVGDNTEKGWQVLGMEAKEEAGVDDDPMEGGVGHTGTSKVGGGVEKE